MQRVGLGAGQVVVDAAAGLLGAEAAMDQPLVLPGGLRRGIRRAGDLVEDVGAPKVTAPVWVGGWVLRSSARYAPGSTSPRGLWGRALVKVASPTMP
jgi:hypothetical protein